MTGSASSDCGIWMSPSVPAGGRMTGWVVGLLAHEARRGEGRAAQGLVGGVLAGEWFGDLGDGGTELVGQGLEQRPVEAVDVGCVAADHHADLVLGYAGERHAEVLPGERPAALEVGEVAPPH